VYLVMADEVEAAALDLAEQQERNEIETAKMRQLKLLLKGLD